MTGPQGGLVMLALAGLLAYLWWAGVLTRYMQGAIEAFTTPRPRNPSPLPIPGRDGGTIGTTTSPFYPIPVLV